MVGRHEFKGSAALRRLFGVAALLGLFAMHGLAAHGNVHPAHAGAPIAVMAAAGQHHSGHAMTTDPTADASWRPHPAGDPAPESGLLGLAALCLAVLLAGVIVTVLLGRGVVVADKVEVESRALGRPARSRRDRDPPCLYALSVQRC